MMTSEFSGAREDAMDELMTPAIAALQQRPIVRRGSI
jgi:hypothetical protein